MILLKLQIQLRKLQSLHFLALSLPLVLGLAFPLVFVVVLLPALLAGFLAVVEVELFFLVHPLVLVVAVWLIGPANIEKLDPRRTFGPPEKQVLLPQIPPLFL